MAETEGEKIASKHVTYPRNLRSLAAAIDSALADRERATREECAKLCEERAEQKRRAAFTWREDNSTAEDELLAEAHAAEHLAIDIRALGSAPSRSVIKEDE